MQEVCELAWVRYTSSEIINVDDHDNPLMLRIGMGALHKLGRIGNRQFIIRLLLELYKNSFPHPSIFSPLRWKDKEVRIYKVLFFKHLQNHSSLSFRITAQHQPPHHSSTAQHHTTLHYSTTQHNRAQNHHTTAAQHHTTAKNVIFASALKNAETINKQQTVLN